MRTGARQTQNTILKNATVPQHWLWAYTTVRPSITTISDPAELAKFSDVWDELIRRCSTSPLFLTGFVKEVMELNRSRGWSPLLLCLAKDGVTIGVAALMTRIQFGIRYARFLLDPWCSPDFVIEDSCRELCIRLIVEHLFQTLHCAILDLTLPADSPNVGILGIVCESSGLHSCKRAASGHNIIRVKGTWDEFRAARGRNFRKYFKGLERRLDRSGSWRIVRLSCDGRDPGAIERIHWVEKMSWKEAWRKRKGKTDEDLLLALRGSATTARRELDFRPWGCFLELGGQTLAYVLVLEYKAVAILLKTSFDERFGEYYPGTYSLNESIRQLFDEGRVTTIDFVIDLPFHSRWSPTCLGRIRVVICRGHVSSIVVRFLTGNAQTKLFAIVRTITSTFPFSRRLERCMS